MKKMSLLRTSWFQASVALVLAVGCGMYGTETLYSLAQHISDIYVKFLRLVSTPLIFLSICSTLSSLPALKDLKFLGKRVMLYTLLTTGIAASIGAGLFLLLSPKVSLVDLPDAPPSLFQGSYKDIVLNIFPSNFVGAFLDNNVIAIMIIAFLIGGATLGLEEQKKEVLKNLFSSLFDVVIRVTGFILKFIPLAIWAFITLLIRDHKNGAEFGPLGIYFITVVGANLVQGVIVLPLLLKMKGYSVFHIVKGFSPALSLAFFSKSSNATLPTTLRCAQKNLGFSQKVSNFTLPLCVTCNMNGCAAFIIVTVLFVATSHGVTFSPLEILVWIGLATLAAVGNAGVPMGCYFLSTAFLTTMNIPLSIMGLILPLYTLIDMIETALNVWSDGVITAIVEKEVS